MLISIECNFPQVNEYVIVEWRNAYNNEEVLGTKTVKDKNDDRASEKLITISGLGRSVYSIGFYESTDGQTLGTMLCQLSVNTENEEELLSLKAEKS